MRAKSEILKEVRRTFNNVYTRIPVLDPFGPGLCLMIKMSRITNEEQEWALRYLREHSPLAFRLKKKTWHKNGYFWKPGKVGPRKRWLNRHIRKFNKKEKKNEQSNV